MNSRSRAGIALSVPSAVLLSLILAAHTVAAALSQVSVGSWTHGGRPVADPVSFDSHAPRSSERIPALMYHRIACAPDWTKGPHRWVCPERFDATLALLKKNGWDTMTARQVSWRLKHGPTFPDKTFIIVTDDGKWGRPSAFC
jgi:hypothetical protein